MSVEQIEYRAKILMDNGRYVEAIQMYNEVVKRDLYRAVDACVNMAYCFNQIGQYRDALRVCDFAVNVNDGETTQQKESKVSYYRNFAIQKLRGRNPYQHSTYDPQDEYVYQQGGDNGYWSQRAKNVMDDTSGINSW